MHQIIASLLPFAAAGAPLAPRQIRPLLALLPGHLTEIMALAALAASSGGTRPFLCGIINAKSGRCAENCAFCAQSAHHDTGSPVYPLVGREALIARAQELVEAGAAYMGIVISGTGPTPADFDRLLEDAGHITAATGIRLCASLGLLHGDQAARLKQAGFTSYHHNLETARSHYASVCGTHDFTLREDTVLLARRAGLRVCSGGIFGLGESWEQRLELSATIAELGAHSIPVNFLNPIPGTPLGNAGTLPAGEALGIVSLLRLMHPGRDIVICGGRGRTLGELDALLLPAGANGLMTGDYLTTSGSPYERDRVMLRALGLAPDCRPVNAPTL